MCVWVLCVAFLLLANYLSENPLCSPDHIARVASSSARTFPRSLYVSASRPRCSRAQPAKRPTSHANFDPVLLLDALRGRPQALERSLRTSPKRPTRAKE